MTWENAKSFCQELNAILAHADTESDFSTIKSFLTSAGTNIFIGLKFSPTVNENIQWIKNNVIFDFEVNKINSNKNDDCVRLNYKGTLKGLTCDTSTSNALCQKTCISDTPTTPQTSKSFSILFKMDFYLKKVVF
jgi:hypothetical protein